MNTLSKAATRVWFKSPESFTALETRWSQIFNSDLRKQLSSTDHLFYAALRGKDWRKGLAPINPETGRGSKKLANGGASNSGIDWACSGIRSDYRWRNFLTLIGDGVIEENAIHLLRKVIVQAHSNELPASAYDSCETEMLIKMSEVSNG